MNEGAVTPDRPLLPLCLLPVSVRNTLVSGPSTTNHVERQLFDPANADFRPRLCENTLNEQEVFLSMRKAHAGEGDEAIHRREEPGTDGVDARVTGRLHW
jgi:hypothetical protein